MATVSEGDIDALIAKLSFSQTVEESLISSLHLSLLHLSSISDGRGLRQLDSVVTHRTLLLVHATTLV